MSASFPENSEMQDQSTAGIPIDPSGNYQKIAETDDGKPMTTGYGLNRIPELNHAGDKCFRL